MDQERIIFHIDVNNAFLSWTAVDLLKKGSKIDIRTIPSIIAGDESKRRGIVLAKSPVAKKYGIVTAETIYSAKRKCRNLKIYAPDRTLYKEQSDQLYHYLCKYTPDIERFSIDESFLDMSHTHLLYDNLLTLAYHIKDEIKEKFGFTVNIGIANNKLCAKMASDFEKPDKVHTLFENEIKTKMWPLPVSDLFMIGKSTTSILKELHINTIQDLAKADINILKHYFKSNATTMHNYANGIDKSPVNNKEEKNKCISVSETLPYDIQDKQTLKQILLKQAEEVGQDLRKQERYTKTIAITLKNSDFISYSHQTRLHNEINTNEEIYKTVCNLLDHGWKKDAIRNIGIRLSDFTETRKEQISLFETSAKKDDKIQKTMDEIKAKYGNTSIIPASLLKQKETGPK